MDTSEDIDLIIRFLISIGKNVWGPIKGWLDGLVAGKLLELDDDIIPVREMVENRARAKALYPQLAHPEIEKLIERKGSSDIEFVHGFFHNGKLVGYNIVYPINKDCVNYLLNHTYKSGAEITHQNIASSWKSAYGLYIAFLISFDPRHRASVLLKNQTFITKMMIESKQPNVFVFGKPSENTFKLIKSYGLRSVSNGARDAVHSIDKNTFFERGIAR